MEPLEEAGVAVPFRAMNVPLLAKGVHNVVAIWALVLGLLAAIIIAAATGRKFMSKNTSVKAALNAGALGSLLAIMNTASEVGYGNVISSLPGFLEVADALLGIGQGMPLFYRYRFVLLLSNPFLQG